MDIPRLEIAQLPAELAAAVQPRVRRLGYLGEFFKCAAHQPKALLSFMAFTDDLKEALADNLTEVVALSVAAWMGNAYERNQHERLCRKLGFTDDWIGAVGAAQAMAILMLIGRYVTHALIVNALELGPPVPSIFEEKTQQPSMNR
jgi:alkylhydroperoxidase family enzyme